MDSGDIIYVILAIGFTVFSSYNKKKKREAKAQSNGQASPPATSIFDKLFDLAGEMDDPVQQTSSYEEYADVSLEDVEEQEVDVEHETPVFKPTIAYKPIFDSEKEKSDQFENTKDKRKHGRKHSRHHQPNLLEQLQHHDEMKRAVIYAEIIKPKF